MRQLRSHVVIVLLIMLIGTGLFAIGQPTSPVYAQAYGTLYVSGHEIINAQGQPVRLLSISNSSLIDSCGGSHLARSDMLAMRNGWNMDMIQIPLSAPRWFNTYGDCPGYRQSVQAAVTAADDSGIYVLLSLYHEDVCGTNKTATGATEDGGAGYDLPDAVRSGHADSSEAFWQSLAMTYRSDNHVLFGLFGEPHDTPWSVWQSGGTVQQAGDSHRAACSYQAIGMQQLVNEVHQIAPFHLELVPGLDWAGDLSGAGGITGPMVVFALHNYPGPHCGKQAYWDECFGQLAETRPVVDTEFGELDCGDSYITAVMPYFAAHLDGMGMWVWSTSTSCSRPGTLARWDGTPNAYATPIRAFYRSLGANG